MKFFLYRWPQFNLCALILTVLAYSTADAKCIQQCDPLDLGVQWLPINQTGLFEYESRSVLVTSDHAQTENDLFARVNISRLDACNYEMRMFDTNSSTFPDTWLQTLNTWPVRFAFQFGRVQQICASKHESQWTLNVKRSLLSSIQLHWSPSDSKQTREGVGKFLHGNCPFAYELLQHNATSKRIRLHVHLQNCQHRLTSIGSLHSHLQNEFDRFDSGLLVQKAQLKCDLLLSNGRQLQQVECLENGRITPLIGSQLTSEIIARQSFRLVHSSPTSQSNSDNSFDLVTTIQFKPDFPSIENVGNKTQQLLQQTQEASAEQILELNQEMQQMKAQTLCDWVLDKMTGPKSSLILDQLIQLGTASSFECIHRLITTTNQFNLTNSRAFFNALTFSKLPTEDGLKQLQILHPFWMQRLNQDQLHAYLLALGGYAHNLIRQTSSEQKQLIIPAISKMVEQLTSELAPKCDNPLDAARLRSLLHLRNYLDAPTCQHVLHCLTNAKSSEQQLLLMQLLLANRNQMEANFHETLFGIFRNPLISIETRLAIFLELIHEPRYQDTLFDLAKKTQDEQMIAYISSYLENELNAEPQFKRDPFLKRVNLNLQTPPSLWKHSQNLVWQRKFGQIGTRLSLDLIRTHDFQLRTLRISGEMSIGERRIDLFEMTIKQSGMDQMIQDFLMKLLTSKTSLQNLFQRLTTVQNAQEMIEMLLQELQQWKQMVSLKEVQIAFNLKLNGNDIFYTRTINTPNDSLNQSVALLMNQLNQLNHTLSFIYLDQEHQLPLSCGWPLVLKLKGNAQNLFKLDFNEVFMKSLENHIIANLGVRTDDQTMIGLQVMSKSKMAIDIGMKVNQTKTSVNVRFHPRSKNIVQLEHETKYFSLQPNSEKKDLLINIKPDQESIQCMHDNQNNHAGIWLTRWSGLACCIHRKQNGDRFGWNKPNFFFNQRQRFDANCKPIESEEQHWLMSYDRQPNEIEIAYDTPNSAVSRNARLHVQQNIPSNDRWQLTAQAQLAKQFINANISYLASLADNQKEVNASLEWNKVRYRAELVDVQLQRNTKAEHRSSLVLFADPNLSQPFVHWKSSLAVDRGRKTVFSGYMLDQLRHMQMWRAFLSLDRSAGQKWTGDIQMFYSLLPFTRAYLQLDLQPQHVSVDAQLEYDNKSGQQQKAKVAFKTQNLTVAQLQRLNTFVQFQSSEFKSCNVLFTHLFVYRPDWYIENDLTFHWPYLIERQEGGKAALTTGDVHRYSIRHVGKTLPVTKAVNKNRFHILHSIQLQLGNFHYAGQSAILWMPGDLPHLRFLVEIGERLSIQAEKQLIQPANITNIASHNNPTIASHGNLIHPPSSSGSLSAILKSAAISSAAGNRLVLIEYRQSSNRPIRLSIVAIAQLGGDWTVQYTDEVRERASNQYQGSTNLEWGKASYARLEYVVRIQSNILREDYDLKSDFTSSALASAGNRLQHSASLRLERNQVQLRSTATYEQKEFWSIKLDVDHDQSNSNKVLLYIECPIGEMKMDSLRTGENQAASLQLQSERLDHSSNFLLNWTASDWRFASKTNWQLQQVFLTQFQLTPGHKTEMRLDSSKMNFLFALEQKPIQQSGRQQIQQSGELEFKLPGPKFEHKSAWNLDNKQVLILHSKTSHRNKHLLGFNLQTGRRSELSIKSWIGTAQLQWVTTEDAKMIATWKAINANNFVLHQGQAQTTPTGLKANCSSVDENNHHWMNVTVQLNAQNQSWSMIEMPDMKIRLSANPFAMEPYFEMNHFRPSAQEQIQISYVIGSKNSRQLRFARDWLSTASDRQQLLQLGWTPGRLEQLHAKLAQQWMKLDWNERKGFDIQLRLWNRLLRQLLLWTSTPSKWLAEVETFVNAQQLLKAGVANKANQQGSFHLLTGVNSASGSYRFDNQTLTSAIWNASIPQFEHQFYYVRTLELFELRTNNSIGLPRQPLFNGLLFANRSVEIETWKLKAETQDYQIESAFRKHGIRKQGIVDVNKRSTTSKFVIDLKSIDDQLGVLCRWRPESSKPSQFELISMIYPRENSSLFLTVGHVRARGWFHSNPPLTAALTVPHGELMANIGDEWQQDWAMAIYPSNSSLLIKGHWQSHNQVLAKITQLGIGLLNPKRPQINLKADLNGAILPSLFQPIVGSQLFLTMALKHDPNLDYLVQMKGDHIDCDAKLSSAKDSQIKWQLFGNRGQLSLIPFAPVRQLHLQGKWNHLDHDTSLKLEGRETLTLNSTTKHSGYNLLTLIGLLSVARSSHVNVYGPQYHLLVALHPYQEVMNLTMDYVNHATNRQHNTHVRYVPRGTFELNSIGLEQQKRWFNLKLIGNRKSGGWLDFEGGCCAQLRANVTLSKDRRELIGNYVDESNDIRHHLNATQYTDTTPVIESKVRSGWGLFGSFSSPSSSSSSLGKQFGVKKVLTEPLNAFRILYWMKRDEQTEKEIHIWAPANGQGGATLESDRYKGEIDFNAGEHRLQYRLWNQEYQLEERMHFQYLAWEKCDASLSRSQRNQTLYEYTLLLCPDQQRLFYQKEPTWFEFKGNLMPMDTDIRTASLFFNQSSDKSIQHQTMFELNQQNYVGSLLSNTMANNQSLYNFEAQSTTDKYLISMTNSSWLNGQFLLSPYSALLFQFDLPNQHFQHRTQGQIGRNLLLESETKRNQKKVFWLRSNLHLTEFFVSQLDGKFTYNDLRDLRLRLSDRNGTTVHETRFLFDGTQLTLLVEHRPANKHVMSLDLLASGTQVSYLRTNNTLLGSLTTRFAWLDWHRLIELQVNSTHVQFGHQSELLIVDQSIDDKKYTIHTQSVWMNERWMESRATWSNNSITFDTELHSKLERILFKFISMHANRNAIKADLDLMFQRSNQTLNATGNAEFKAESQTPEMIHFKLDSQFWFVPTGKLFARQYKINQTLELSSEGHLGLYTYDLGTKLDGRYYPLEMNVNTKGQVNVALVQFRRNFTSNATQSSLLKVGWNEGLYGYEINCNESNKKEWAKLILHLRRRTTQLEWQSDVNSATARFMPNRNSSTNPYEIRVQSHDLDRLNLLSARYEILHPSLGRNKIVDLRLDRLEKGNLTFDLLSNESKTLHLAYEFSHEFDVYTGRLWAHDHNRHVLDLEMESFLVASNPLSGTALKLKWLTGNKTKHYSQARYLLQLNGPEMLIIDDSVNRIELTAAQLVIPQHSPSLSQQQQIDTISITSDQMNSIDSHSSISSIQEDRRHGRLQHHRLAFVQQLRVNQRILQFQSAESNLDQHCWTLAMSDQVSPNVQQRLCVDRSYGAGVIKAQMEQWMAGLLQSHSTLTWNLDDEQMQLHAKYDSKQWTQMMDSLRDLLSNMQINRYDWSLLRQEIHQKQSYLEEVLLTPLQGDLVQELVISIQEFRLQTILETIVKSIHQFVGTIVHTSVSWIGRTIQTANERWIHQWSDLFQLALHNLLHQVGTYNGNILQMLSEWIQTVRQNYLTKVKRWLDDRMLTLLDVLTSNLKRFMHWLQRRPLFFLANNQQLSQLLLRIRQELDLQRELVQTDRFNYIRKVISLVSTLFPPSAWFEPPNEFTWQPDRGELTIILGNGGR